MESVAIENYGPFRDRVELQLGRGFNVIIGRNNAGKSCILNALRGNLDARPHRSADTKPASGSWNPQPSIAEYRWQIPAAEFWVLLAPLAPVQIPAGKKFSGAVNHATAFAAMVKTDPWQLSWREQARSNAPNTTSRELKETEQGLSVRHSGTDARQQAQGPAINVGVSSTNQPQNKGTAGNVPKWMQRLSAVAERIRKNVLWFDAERMGLGSCPTKVERVRLRPRADNLPAVINELMTTNLPRFERYKAIVREILPEIQGIDSVFEMEADENRIRIWMHDPASEREDLCMNLDECGSGTSQVLALAYAILEDSPSRVIVIDEPQSFLHPGALRSLMAVLARHGRNHQFIVATHSPHVIAATRPDKVFLVTRAGDDKNPKSDVREVDREAAREAQHVLAEVGAQISDVFGAEVVLWVEGETEELFLQLLLVRLLEDNGAYTKVLSVHSTGDFDTRRKKAQKRAIETHERLAQGGALLPAKVAFLLDRENRDDQEMKDLRKLATVPLAFLERKMLENYLLDAEAIAAVANANGAKTSKDAVEGRLAEMVGHGLGLPVSAERTAENWIKNTDGARVLKEILEAECPDGFEYRKTRDTVAIGEWLLENRPDALFPLSNQVKTVLSAA